MFATVTERFSKNRASINEKVEFILFWSIEDDIEWQLPQKGIRFSENGLPLFEIHKIDKFENEIRILVSFFNSGSFTLPIEYIENDEKKKTEQKIKIVSILTGQEQDVQPLEPPFAIKGNILPRLLFFIFLFLFFSILLFSIFYWIFLKIKQKKKKQEDLTEIVTSFQDFRKQKNKLNEQLQKLLSQEPILFKKLVFLLSDILKAEISYIYKKDLYNLTEKELFHLLTQEYQFSQKLIDRWYPIFLRQKYTNIKINLNKEEAKNYIKDWNQFLEL